MKKNKNQKNLKKRSLPIFECQHTVTLGTGKGNAVRTSWRTVTVNENRL